MANGVGESWKQWQIKPVNPKGNQSWIFIGRPDAEVSTSILWPPDEKNWLIRKDPDAGKDWRQEKGMTEAEMVGWHHQLDGHEFEQAPWIGEGQGSLVCCSLWSCKELDMTEQLKWPEWQITSSLALKALQKVTAAMKSEDICFLAGKESYDKSRQCFEKQRHYSANKGSYSQGSDLPSGNVPFWELDHEELEHQKTEAFALWCWRRLLRVPWMWTWTWASFRRWWGTGRTGMLQSMGSQRVRHGWEIDQQPSNLLIQIKLSWSLY